jgi:hypothetical protein
MILFPMSLRIGDGSLESRAILGHDDGMDRWKWAAGGTVVFIAAAGLGLFLVTEGLARASAWVTVLGFPLVLAGTAVAVWSAVQAVKAGREVRHEDGRIQQDTHDPSGADGRARPEIGASGSIRQTSQGGPTIGHTGIGDINLTNGR